MRNQPIIITSYPVPTDADITVTYNYKDITGQRFGRLLAICRWVGGLTQFGINEVRPYWVCKCDCGNLCITFGKALRTGKIQSCGCLHRENLSNYKKCHGMTRSRIYRIYRDMVRRCYQPTRKSYERYGGRGIYICDEWYTPGVDGSPGFAEFMRWSMVNGYNDSLSIDRIDNDGPYAPWNCRWVDMITQQNNKSTNRHITDNDGTVRTYTEFERHYHLYANYVLRHVYRGWTLSAIVYAVHNSELNLTMQNHTIRDSSGFIHMVPKIEQKEVKPDGNKIYG